jgi:alkylation response protein AidB-like acyl-CoA dehydrogenase
MSFLGPARETLDRYMPGLDKQLAGVPLQDLEKPGNEGLAMFRASGGPALLVPAEFGGLGASVAEAVNVQRAIGSRSPSLAVATTMHHFSVASLVELDAAGDGLEWAMLEALAANNWLLSSGFAEGRTGQHILAPTMKATVVPDGGGLVVNGTKKPCSLTWSMDLMSASVAVADPAGGPDRMAVVLIPASSGGIERRKFWQSWVLGGAESDEVVLRDVQVPEALVFYPTSGPTMDPVQAHGFVWFELLISAAYVGAASGLVERVLEGGRGSADDRALLAIELEAATAALEQVANAAAAGGDIDFHLAQALCVRYAAERAIERVAMAASALAGGMAFIGSSDIAYLLAASRALAFHPPSRATASEPLTRHLAGEPLNL